MARNKKNWRIRPPETDGGYKPWGTGDYFEPKGKEERLKENGGRLAHKLGSEGGEQEETSYQKTAKGVVCSVCMAFNEASGSPTYSLINGKNGGSCPSTDRVNLVAKGLENGQGTPRQMAGYVANYVMTHQFGRDWKNSEYANKVCNDMQERLDVVYGVAVRQTA